MKIDQINILNFKSIKNSGFINLEKDITILAGKNESGKTTILEAIEAFNTSKEIPVDAKPIDDLNAIPEIIISFTLIEKEKIELINGFNKYYSKEKCEKPNITISKKYPNKYELYSGELLTIFDESSNERIKSLIDERNAYILKNKALSISLGINPQHIYLKNQKFEDILTNLKKEFEFLSKDEIKSKLSNEQNQEISSLIEKEKLVIEGINSNALIKQDLLAFFLKITPQFTYFSSFDNMLDFETPINQIDSKPTVSKFIKLLGVDTSILINPSITSQEKKNHLRGKSITITGDFLSYWEQGKIELQADINGENLLIGFIEEGNNNIFRMDQRSKGFQWFLSFYILLNTPKSIDSGSEKFLLIDEPGLYLHAKAQKDVLKVLENLSNNIPCIYSTHSPYLIEPEKLHRIRLVFKENKEGTIIEEDFYKISDKETLTPIMTAIGLEITNGITNPEHQNNVVIEGKSDWFYLTAFRKFLDNGDLNFIYGGGTGNMPIVSSILVGWGCKVVLLFDNDKGGKDGRKNIKSHWIDLNLAILEVTKAPNKTIEDLFTVQDFKKLVLEDEKLTYTTSNSDYLKSSEKNKAMIARKFLSNIDIKKDDISEETKKGFISLFSEIVKSF